MQELTPEQELEMQQALMSQKFKSNISISTNTPWTSLHNRNSNKEDKWYVYEINEQIIKEASDLLLERLQNGDTSLSIKDIIAAKEAAFKQNQAIDWLDDSLDTRKLIPTQINIQVINN